MFGPLADANVNVDMIVQSTGDDGTTNMTFTVGKTDLTRAISVLEANHGATRTPNCRPMMTW